MPLLSLPISFGEAADKLSILQIKREQIQEPEKLANIQREFMQVSEIVHQYTKEAAAFSELLAKLRNINERLWDVENAIRDHDRRQDFGPGFVRLARAVYLTNDERQRVKRQIDELFDSPIREEKSYVDYNPPAPGA